MQKIEGLEDQMECSDVMLALILFIDDEFHDEIQVETFQTHFQQCPECLSEMEHERQVLTRMKSLLTDECCEQAPEDLNSRIAQQTALLASQMFSPTQIITEYRRTETTINGETHIEIETTHEIRRDFPLS
jgi:mycothiol system anti-sigma-R factor